MREVEGIIRINEDILRQTHLLVRNKCWYVNIDKESKNPYIQRVIAMEEEEEEAKKMHMKVNDV
eukprot:CAMPEP_0172495882 /NCGR_PEP_ID=MMETSP1066-20121228/79511_1 /TAXON_ID=671091 /ORGANISM="Coscinodiscus wailesii, Strain CCMP2513" /LENGTH=63 /DNA_ID=CAMNT_0013267881 /DNA_START=350 /DNA_END=541 /DNA_ORIENTATION=-